MIRSEHKILIAGAYGMVGKALVRLFQKKGFQSLLTPTKLELNYLDQKNVREFIRANRPDVVIIAAAKVGGIHANQTYPASFLYENLMIASNLIHEAHLANVDRLLFLGSSCIYPKFAPQPIPEEALLTAPLEPTNEGYALAKIAGVKLCQFYRREFGRNYISAMPTNLYGLNDNYHPENSHVIPGLIRRFVEAAHHNLKQMTLWGTGKALREFLYVDDLAEACFFLLEKFEGEIPINVGSDEEISILDLAKKIARYVGFEGEIVHDLSKPDGTPRKKTDLSKIKALGWQAKTRLDDGLPIAISDFKTYEFKECALSMK